MGLIPTRYPGSAANESEQVRLARRTEWQEIGDEIYSGLGQRVLATDTAEYALMDVRQIDLETGVEAASEVSGG